MKKKKRISVSPEKRDFLKKALESDGKLDLFSSIMGGYGSDCASDPTIHYADTVYVRK